MSPVFSGILTNLKFVVVINEPYVLQNVDILKERCRDPAVSVRKQALQSLNDLLYEFPLHNFIIKYVTSYGIQYMFNEDTWLIVCDLLCMFNEATGLIVCDLLCMFNEDTWLIVCDLLYMFNEAT